MKKQAADRSEEWEILISILSDPHFGYAQLGLPKLYQLRKLTNAMIDDLFAIEEKLIVGEFLDHYEHLTKHNLQHIQSAILPRELKSTNALYVSDLLDFATYLYSPSV